MQASVYTCIYVYCKSVYICIQQKQLCVCVCVCVCVCRRFYTCVLIYRQTDRHTHSHTCMYVCTHTYIHTYIGPLSETGGVAIFFSDPFFFGCSYAFSDAFFQMSKSNGEVERRRGSPPGHSDAYSNFLPNLLHNNCKSTRQNGALAVVVQ